MLLFSLFHSCYLITLLSYSVDLDCLFLFSDMVFEYLAPLAPANDVLCISLLSSEPPATVYIHVFYFSLLLLTVYFLGTGQTGQDKGKRYHGRWLFLLGEMIQTDTRNMTWHEMNDFFFMKTRVKWFVLFSQFYSDFNFFFICYKLWGWPWGAWVGWDFIFLWFDIFYFFDIKAYSWGNVGSSVWFLLLLHLLRLLLRRWRLPLVWSADDGRVHIATIIPSFYLTFNLLPLLSHFVMYACMATITHHCLSLPSRNQQKHTKKNSLLYYLIYSLLLPSPFPFPISPFSVAIHCMHAFFFDIRLFSFSNIYLTTTMTMTTMAMTLRTKIYLPARSVG